MESFLGAPPAPHPMQVLSPSESNHSHRKLEESPRIKDEGHLGQGQRSYKAAASGALSASKRVASGEVSAAERPPEFGRARGTIRPAAQGITASATAPNATTATNKGLNATSAHLDSAQAAATSKAAILYRQGAGTHSSNASLRNNGKDQRQHLVVHPASNQVQHQFRGKERKKSSKAAPGRHGHPNSSINANANSGT